MTLPRSSAYKRFGLEYIERPASDADPVEPRPMFWTLLAVMVGLALAAATAFVIEYLRGRLRDPRQIEAATGLRLVGTVVEKRGDIRRGPTARVITLNYPDSSEAEAYRRVLTAIEYAVRERQGLLVTGPASADVLAAVAANLAAAYAELGRRTIIVDADLRSPALHAFLDVAIEPGLTTVLLSSRVSVAGALAATRSPGLHVLPSGRPPIEPAERVASIALPNLLRHLATEADIVIARGAPLPGSPASAVLAATLGATLVLIPEGAPSDTAVEATRDLEATGARIVGVVRYRTVRGSHRRRDARTLPSDATPAQWSRPGEA